MTANMGARQARNLREVSRELRRVNLMLRRIAGGGALRDGESDPPRINGASVRAIIAARRLRDECFGSAVGDLAWAVLLEAFAARLDGRLTAMTSLGASAGIARSTSHRWAAWLLARGLLVRHPDPGNRRGALIGLGDDAAARIHDYLTAAGKMSHWLC